jgi:hypothetical protein
MRKEWKVSRSKVITQFGTFKVSNTSKTGPTFGTSAGPHASCEGATPFCAGTSAFSPEEVSAFRMAFPEIVLQEKAPCYAQQGRMREGTDSARVMEENLRVWNLLSPEEKEELLLSLPIPSGLRAQRANHSGDITPVSKGGINMLNGLNARSTRIPVWTYTRSLGTLRAWLEQGNRPNPNFTILLSVDPVNVAMVIAFRDMAEERFGIRFPLAIMGTPDMFPERFGYLFKNGIPCPNTHHKPGFELNAKKPPCEKCGACFGGNKPSFKAYLEDHPILFGLH